MCTNTNIDEEGEGHQPGALVQEDTRLGITIQCHTGGQEQDGPTKIQEQKPNDYCLTTL